MSTAFRKLAHDPGDAQITSHCPFCGSGQVTGRSDGNIECSFCGMTYLVRIQPMFTGMPGNPSPGFGGETSMAPDLMDPAMMGPDGMPMDEEGMPPEDEEGGAPPFGGEEAGEGPPDDEASGDAAGPPPAADDDSGPPPPKGSDTKKKDKSKKGARGYRTIAGDVLPESAYIRHLAVLHGGVEVIRRAAAADPLDQHLRAYHDPVPGEPGWDRDLYHDREHEYEGHGGRIPHEHRYPEGHSTGAILEDWETRSGDASGPHDFTASRRQAMMGVYPLTQHLRNEHGITRNAYGDPFGTDIARLITAHTNDHLHGSASAHDHEPGELDLEGRYAPDPDPDWETSGDAARSPRFIARRTA